MDIKISNDLNEKLQNHLRESSFRSLDELVNFILNDYIKKIEEYQNENMQEDETLNKRLKDLGYF